MLLIGSKALAYWLCGNPQRVPNDTDLICTHAEAKDFIEQMQPDQVYPNEKATTIICRWKDERTNPAHRPVELMIAWPGSTTEEIYQLERNYAAILDGGTRLLCSLDTLYLIKMSHRYLRNSPHFLKTMRDIQLMRSLGARIQYPDLLKRRETETYNYAHPSLTRNKKKFFDPKEGVGYQYDHDTLHLAMAIDPGKPAYTHYQKDGAEVQVDRRKWDAVSEQIKLNSVVEESLVLALERSQIPYRGKVDPRRSFDIAIQKVCTSISSGWWREYAWEHFDHAVALYEAQEAVKPYLQRFDEALAAGIVKQLATQYHE